LHYYENILPGSKSAGEDHLDTISKHKEILAIPNDKEEPIPANYTISRFKIENFDYLFKKDEVHAAFLKEKKRMDNILGQMRSNDLYKNRGGLLINKRDGRNNLISIKNEINPYYKILEILLPQIGDFMETKIPYYEDAILKERWPKYDLFEMQNNGVQDFITISKVFGLENYLPIASKLLKTKKGEISFAKNSGNPYKKGTPEECMLGYQTELQYLREDCLEQMLLTLSPFIVIFLKSMEENALEGYEASSLRLHNMTKVGKILDDIISKNKFFNYIIPNKDDTPNGGVARAKMWYDTWKGGQNNAGTASIDRIFAVFWPNTEISIKEGKKYIRIPLAMLKKNQQTGPKHAISRSIFRKALYKTFYFFADHIPQYVKKSSPINIYTEEAPDYSNVLKKYMPFK
jgi:hypothetical protein